MSEQELTRFMWMSSPQEALSVIAEMIDMEEPIEAQDEWLKAAVTLGYVHDKHEFYQKWRDKNEINNEHKRFRSK